MNKKLTIPKKLEEDFKNLLTLGLSNVPEPVEELTKNEQAIVKLVRKYVNE